MMCIHYSNNSCLFLALSLTLGCNLILTPTKDCGICEHILMMSYIIQTWLHMPKAKSKTDVSKRTKSNRSIGVWAYSMLRKSQQKRPVPSEETRFNSMFSTKPSLAEPSLQWFHSFQKPALEGITTVSSQPEISSVKSPKWLQDKAMWKEHFQDLYYDLHPLISLFMQTQWRK